MSNEWSKWASLGRPGETDFFSGLFLSRHADGGLALFASSFLRSERADGSWSEWEQIGDGTLGGCPRIAGKKSKSLLVTRITIIQEMR